MRPISQLVLGATLLTLSACGENAALQIGAANNQASTAEQQVTLADQAVPLDIQFSAFLNDGTNNPALGPEIMHGTVVAENIQTGEIITNPIIVQLLNGYADSLSTLNLKPGDYNFTVSFSREGQFYVGQESMFVQENLFTPVPVFVSPVIGDSVVDVETDTLVDLEFNIALDEVNSANLTDPMLEVTIDGSTDIFIINPGTGLSQRMWLNLPARDHTVSVALVDEGLIVGQSEEQVITVNGDDNLTIDIAPLYGQVRYDLFVEGGSANIEVNVPQVVIDTVGGLQNLESTLVIAASDGSSFFAEPLTLIPEGDGFRADVIAPDVSYGLHTLEVDFYDIAQGEPVGNCFEEETFTTSGVTVSCQIQLSRDSALSATLQSAVAVNVFDSLGFPLPGATVSVDGEAVSVTGNDFNATPGYANVFVRPGSHIIRADFGAEFGEVEYQSQALNSANINIFMGQTVNSNPVLFDEDFTFDPNLGLYPMENFWFACASNDGFPEATVETDFSRLALPSYVLDCSANSAVTQQEFTQPEISAAGGFEVLLDLTGDADAGAELSIGIGEEAVGDPLSFVPSDSADAVVTLRDSEVEITIYDAGSAVQTITRPTPFALSSVSTVAVDVALTSLAAGADGTVNVKINGTSGMIEAVPFTWDGGPNHIELRGGNQIPGNGTKVYVDRIQVRPR